MILAGFRPTLFCIVHCCAPHHHLDCLVRFKGFYFCSFSLFVFSANFLYICVYFYSGTESQQHLLMFLDFILIFYLVFHIFPGVSVKVSDVVFVWCCFGFGFKIYIWIITFPQVSVGGRFESAAHHKESFLSFFLLAFRSSLS